ncbi:hypothetical protein CGCA056_v000742 [Colletotrichum aenigma]|uniref:uncharacterized protein n=1 Tax=Colletotrichum aenigma TaxID=1215731 RepID=UPI00187272D6|nr:uncharacterized protein CGCA056_v000742 [Colletotrichum aenigma]KAF5527892.1 hypothetical protein CGCA056_v000742 [Colletotrichum aenigma]
MAPVFPFRYTIYGAGFSAAHDPSFPISDRPDGRMAFLNPVQRMRFKLDRKKVAQLNGRPFLVQWFLPITRWGKTLKNTIEDDLRNLVHPGRLLHLSLYSISRRTIEHPQSDIVIVAQVATEEARPNHSQLRSQVYPEILRLLSSPEVGRPKIGCYVEYAVDPRRLLNPLGILPPQEPRKDLTRTPDLSSSGSSSSSNSSPSCSITAPLDSDGPQPPGDEDEKAKEEADLFSEFFDIDAYYGTNSPGDPSTES